VGGCGVGLQKLMHGSWEQKGQKVPAHKIDNWNTCHLNFHMKKTTLPTLLPPETPAADQHYQFPLDKLTKSVTNTHNEDKSVTSPTPLVLLACGAFSPITYLHLRLFEIVKDHFKTRPQYSVVGGYISPVSDSYNKKGLESAQHRLAMCRLAASTSQWIMVDDWESSIKEYTTTIKVINHLYDNLRDIIPGVKVILICGSDLLETFNKPGVWAEQDMEDICKSGIACLERAGSDVFEVIDTNPILWKYQNNIAIVKQYISNDISSTKVRTAIQRGRSIHYLLPEPVVQYIEQHNLFKN